MDHKDLRFYNGSLIHRSRNLRKNMTRQEGILWYKFLRTYSIRFYRQRIINNFIVDFYCPKARLIIEIDGGQHYRGYNIFYDKKRTLFLEKYGLIVLRYTNLDIDYRFSAVCDHIHTNVENRIKSLNIVVD